jgi:hypothetical protein
VEIAEVFLSDGNDAAEDTWPDLLLDADAEGLEALATLHGAAHALLVGAAKLKQRADDLVARQLGEGGYVRFGDQYLEYLPSRESKLIDPSATREWLGEAFAEAVNPTYIRKGDVEKHAVLLYEQTVGPCPLGEGQAEWEAARDEFLAAQMESHYRTVTKPAKVKGGSIAYLSGERPWLAEMADGDVRRLKRFEEKPDAE